MVVTTRRKVNTWARSTAKDLNGDQIATPRARIAFEQLKGGDGLINH